MVYYTTRSWGGSLMFKASRFPRGGLIVGAVIVLCLGFSLTLVSSPARGSQDTLALGMNHVLPADQVASVNAPPLEGLYYPFALAEQSDDPVNSGLLRMLFLAVSFLGTSVVGWLHTKAQGQGALCFLGVVGKVLGRLREEYLPFLGVFRL
jgi:hypothetical protein